MLYLLLILLHLSLSCSKLRLHQGLLSPELLLHGHLHLPLVLELHLLQEAELLSLQVPTKQQKPMTG